MRSDVTLRMCDDRLCQDCDNANRAALPLKGRACADRPSVTVNTATASASDGTSTTNHHALDVSNRQDGVIVDELLCFLVNKIDVLPPQSIADLCLTTYDEGEIEAAKKRLFDLCADENSSRFRRRQGPKKSAANLDDMIPLLQEKGTDVPLFVARDLSRLPPITFDSVDVSSLLHSVRRAQLEIDVLKASVGIQRDATVDLTEIVKAVDLRMAAVETASIVPAVPVAMVMPAAVVDADDITLAKQLATTAARPDDTQWLALGETSSAVTTICASSTSVCAPSTSVCAPLTSVCAPLTSVCAPSTSVCAPSTSVCAPSTSVCAPSTSVCAPSTSSRAPTTTEWTTVVRRPHNTKQPSRVNSTGARPKKKTGVTGNGQGSGLRSVKRKRLASIFATRFEPHVSCDDIELYLKSRLVGNVPVKVDAIPTKFSTYASFHITCECDEPAIFMDPSLWPEDIFVRWWRSPASSSSTASTAKSSPSSSLNSSSPKASTSKSSKTPASKSSSPTPSTSASSSSAPSLSIRSRRASASEATCML